MKDNEVYMALARPYINCIDGIQEAYSGEVVNLATRELWDTADFRCCAAVEQGIFIDTRVGYPYDRW